VEQKETKETPDSTLETHPDELLVEAHYELAYDEIVTPDRVVVLPGYFRKYLRLVGPDLGGCTWPFARRPILPVDAPGPNETASPARPLRLGAGSPNAPFGTGSGNLRTGSA